MLSCVVNKKKTGMSGGGGAVTNTAMNNVFVSNQRWPQEYNRGKCRQKEKKS